MRRDVFQAIADPTRRDIINLIARKSLNLNSIAENFEMSRPAISQHIKILTECGIVVINQQGRERYCEVQPKKLMEVADWLEPFREMWEARFDKLDTLLKEMQSKKKE
ncbi:metalloregulator ArsR/SmtB family transcription factor [uncultured Roseivirga sp.]|jgi:DNA-binding transcriptional ArsR family regulator|uniref:ArsR/SmtB family transcription factor n=1 Tax=uncultured Roseivirga sp. TaxID=543088 RepID=UPI0030DBE9A4|tara:strand:- start:87500 stop:87823 length:324 start_codon:yes stop_codon:yes gene_type:complete